MEDRPDTKPEDAPINIDEKKLEKNVKKALKKMQKEEKKFSINSFLLSIALTFVVLVILSAGVIYFIHLSDKNLLETGSILGICYFPPGISCQDSRVLDHGFSIKIMNGLPENIIVTSISAGNCHSRLNATMGDGETAWFNLTGCDLTKVFNEETIFTYKNAESGLTHEVKGRVQTTLRSDSTQRFAERVNYEYTYLRSWIKNLFR